MQLRPSIRIASSIITIAVRARMSSSFSSKPTLRGVIFNMDGTLTVPNLDVAGMYARCNIPRNEDILESIAKTMSPAEAEHAWKVIDEVEEEGRRTLRLAPGAKELGVWLRAHGVPVALVTRNSSRSAEYFARELWGIHDGVGEFSPLISRDRPRGLPPKPDPAVVRYVGEEWSFDGPSPELVVVGNANDVPLGKRAGASTALVRKSSDDDDGRGGEDPNETTDEPDIRMEELRELPRQLWRAFRIGGALGTDVPLLKYPPPEPTGVASVAAFEGDADRLNGLPLSELNRPDESGNTPLVWASDAGRVAAVDLLLSRGVDADARGYLGATAACRASRRGRVDALMSLLDGGASPDVPNEKMQYPLHFAAFKRNPEIVAMLLEAGANPLVLDRKGRTPAEDTSDSAIRDMISKVATEAATRTTTQSGTC